MSLIKNILNRFSAEKEEKPKKEAKSDNNENVPQDRLTNEVIFQELVEHFRSTMQEESFSDRMVYPMSFNILIHSNDYPRRKQYLPLIPPVVVNEFHKIIAEEKHKYKNATPIARQWTFQFSSCSQENIGDGEGGTMIVREGHIATVAHLCSEVATNQIDVNSVVSLKLDRSNVFNGTNINMEALKNIDIINEGFYCVNFDQSILGKTPSVAEETIIQPNADGVLATLSYSTNAAFTNRYLMKHNLIQISGKNELRQDPSILKLELDNIDNTHVQVRYIPESGKFQISAFARTRLNGKLLEVSDGGQIKWYDLANNSKIFLNDTINIHFQINN